MMVIKYKKEICEKLISIYENRYINGSDFAQKISLKFNDKGYKKYVADDAYNYRGAIDEAVIRAEKEGFISATYYTGTKDISEVKLNINKVKDVYSFIGKTDIAVKYKNSIDRFKSIDSELSKKLVEYIETKRIDKTSIQKYIDKADFYINALKAIEIIENLSRIFS